MAKKENKKAKSEKFVANNIEEAVNKIIENSNNKKRKFTESVDIAINLNIDPKQSDQNVRGSVLLPKGSGKKVRVAVFTGDEAKEKEALEAGAALAGFQNLVDKVQAGELDFDYCIATPDIMPKIGKVAKVLGPRGLMPSPKNGSVTADVKKAVEEALKGKINFKNEKAGIIHCLVGKVDFKAEDLVENIQEVVKIIKDSKPEAAKGKFIKAVHLNSTMGPAVELSLDSI